MYISINYMYYILIVIYGIGILVSDMCIFRLGVYEVNICIFLCWEWVLMGGYINCVHRNT